MANELTISVSLDYDKNNVVVNESVSKFLATVAGNGLSARTSYTAPTSATALPLGSVTVPGGWLFILNTDDTNFVKVLTSTVGTEFARLYPGYPALIPLAPGITAIALQSDTAACIVEYAIFDL